MPRSGSRWEVERDRFGYFCHPDLEVGECVAVMPVAEHEAEVGRLGKAWDEAATIGQRQVERLDELEAALRHVVKNCYCQPSGQTCDLCQPALLALNGLPSSPSHASPGDGR